MPTLPWRLDGLWKLLLTVVALFTSTSCLVVFSTSPTSASNANIVFVAADDHGKFVESLHVTVIDLGGDWRVDGVTGRDGSYRCAVQSGVSRVRVEVSPPAAFVFANPEEWPRELDVPPGNMRVDVQVTAKPH
jgi:hypothetical protein